MCAGLCAVPARESRVDCGLEQAHGNNKVRGLSCPQQTLPLCVRMRGLSRTPSLVYLSQIVCGVICNIKTDKLARKPVFFFFFRLDAGTPYRRFVATLSLVGFLARGMKRSGSSLLWEVSTTATAVKAVTATVVAA
jgi:hypothetical protein